LSLMTFLPSPPRKAPIGPGRGVVVSGKVMDSGRWRNKILVFHFKRKKQYKKIYGHRQPFTAVRITEIAFDGQRFAAPGSACAQNRRRSLRLKPRKAGLMPPRRKAPPQQKAKPASPRPKRRRQKTGGDKRQEKRSSGWPSDFEKIKQV